MYKVGIIGPESTGKSTLSAYLAHRYNGMLIPEYAREYMEHLAPDYTYPYEDIVAIARQQIQQLEELHQAFSTKDTLVFFDTELIITTVWFEHKYGIVPDFVLEALHRYPMDIYLLCYPDMPWQPDPVRENPNIREYLFEWYEREIQTLNIPYYIIKHT